MPAAFQLGGVVILVDPRGLDAGAVAEYLAANAGAIATILLAGGPAALTEAIDVEALSAIATAGEPVPTGRR